MALGDGAKGTGSDTRHVGLFRALLLAHGQMMVNRTRKGLGRRGVIGLVLVILMLIVSAAPLFGTFGFLGYIFGRSLDEPLAAILMGGVLMAVTAGFGIIGGMLGGARQLTWDAYRSFPIPFRTLFFAETFASVGDMVVLAFLGMCVSMLGAFGWESPHSAPLAVLLFAQLLLWALFVQHLVGALAVTAVRRLRRAMIVLVVAAWVGVSVISGAARELHDDLQGTEVEHLKSLWHTLRPIVELFPTVLSVRAMVAVRQGAYLRGAALELPMLAVTLLLGGASYALLKGEARPQLTRAETPWASGRRFGGTSEPRWVVARLHLHHVAASLQGRFGLVVPLITVVLIRGPVGAVGIGPALTLPGAVIYLALTSTQFHFNQFGFDGQGVKTLFLLPVTMRDVLLGKAFALLAYSAVQFVLLFLMLVALVHPSWRDTCAAALLAACLSLAHVLEGHWLSAIYPRLLAMHRINSTGISGANLLPLGVGMANGAVFGGLYGLLTWLEPAARVPFLAALLVAVIAVYRLLLPRAAEFVNGRREKVVEVLG